MECNPLLKLSKKYDKVSKKEDIRMSL